MATTLPTSTAPSPVAAERRGPGVVADLASGCLPEGISGPERASREDELRYLLLIALGRQPRLRSWLDEPSPALGSSPRELLRSGRDQEFFTALRLSGVA